jgi:hypothetical protein
MPDQRFTQTSCTLENAKSRPPPSMEDLAVDLSGATGSSHKSRRPQVVPAAGRG